jgi:UDP-glucose 4-epimerase
MDIFLTGGTGFIGSYVVMRLTGEGHRVTILARNPDKIPALGDVPGVELIKGHMADFAVIQRALQGKDAAIHIALCWGDTAQSMLHNDTRTSVHLFETAAVMGVERFIYTSSTAAFGEFYPTMAEGMRSRPVGYYGATKEASEQFLLAVANRYPMRGNVIRPGYAFGNPVIEGAPIERDSRFKEIAAKAARGQEIELNKNDGTQFIWAGDLAKVYEALLTAEVDREVYHALGVRWVAWAEIAQKAVELAGSSSTVRLKGEEPEPYTFDLSKMQDHLGLAFDPWPHIVEHLEWLLAKNAGQQN